MCPTGRHARSDGLVRSRYRPTGQSLLLDCGQHDHRGGLNHLDHLLAPTVPGEQVRPVAPALTIAPFLSRIGTLAAQNVDLKSVSGWQTVVTNTGGPSVTTAMNVVREVERRLEQSPSGSLLDTAQSLLEKLNAGQLNK